MYTYIYIYIYIICIEHTCTRFSKEIVFFLICHHLINFHFEDSTNNIKSILSKEPSFQTKIMYFTPIHIACYSYEQIKISNFFTNCHSSLTIVKHVPCTTNK